MSTSGEYYDVQSVYMFFTYVLLCGDGKHYIGYTANIEKRFERHKNGYVFATKGRLPVKLIFYEAFLHQQDATRREEYFKTTAGKRALKLMMREYYTNRESGT